MFLLAQNREGNVGLSHQRFVSPKAAPAARENAHAGKSRAFFFVRIVFPVPAELAAGVESLQVEVAAATGVLKGKAMRVFIATFGARGDVEPFLALGLGLKDAGHEVVLYTARRFESWIAGYGLAARSVSDDLLDLMDAEDGRTVMDPAGRPLSAMRAGLRMNRAAGPINERMMRE